MQAHFADERGSIVAMTDGAGAALAINSYDEYGIPGAANQGRFQYTGQAWLPEIGMYYYRNRIYSPTLGRFLQTDPADYASGMNLYAYVLNDPVNFVDPSGLTPTAKEEVITITATWRPQNGVPPPLPTNLASLVVVGAVVSTNEQRIGGEAQDAGSPGCPRGMSLDPSRPDLTGKASSYGELPNGRPDPANLGRHVAQPGGGVFDPNALAGASRRPRVNGRMQHDPEIPLGTPVFVQSMIDPSRSVSVVINDSGGLRPDTVIDLTPRAMQALSDLRYNKIPVRVYICRPTH